MGARRHISAVQRRAPWRSFAAHCSQRTGKDRADENEPKMEPPARIDAPQGLADRCTLARP